MDPRSLQEEASSGAPSPSFQRPLEPARSPSGKGRRRQVLQGQKVFQKQVQGQVQKQEQEKKLTKVEFWSYGPVTRHRSRPFDSIRHAGRRHL